MAASETSTREAGFVPPQLGKDSPIPVDRSIPISVGGAPLINPELSTFAKIRQAVERRDWDSLIGIMGLGENSSDQPKPSDRE